MKKLKHISRPAGSVQVQLYERQKIFWNKRVCTKTEGVMDGESFDNSAIFR